MISLSRFGLSHIILLLVLVITACSKKDEITKECPPTLDVVEQLLVQQHDGQELYLVRRISGWQDKTVIIQLFDKKPVLDSCNEDLVPPLFEDSIDTGRPLLKLNADISAHTFELIYGEPSIEQSVITLEVIP